MMKVKLRQVKYLINLEAFVPSLVAQKVKHLPAIRETWVQSLGQEDPLEKELATHSSTLAWNGTPLQYSCLENSMDRGAW